MAICTLEPPHSTPISRMMATEASAGGRERRGGVTHRLHSCTGYTVVQGAWGCVPGRPARRRPAVVQRENGRTGSTAPRAKQQRTCSHNRHVFTRTACQVRAYTRHARARTAQALQLLVRERLGRRHRDRVACVYAARTRTHTCQTHTHTHTLSTRARAHGGATRGPNRPHTAHGQSRQLHTCCDPRLCPVRAYTRDTIV
jgi:hypothetical protein